MNVGVLLLLCIISQRPCPCSQISHLKQANLGGKSVDCESPSSPMHVTSAACCLCTSSKPNCGASLMDVGVLLLCMKSDECGSPSLLMHIISAVRSQSLYLKQTRRVAEAGQGRCPDGDARI